MKIDELIEERERVREEHGNLEAVPLDRAGADCIEFIGPVGLKDLE